VLEAYLSLGLRLKKTLFINGVWQDSTSQETYSRVNPAVLEEKLGEFQKGTALDVKKAIDSAEDACSKWADTSPPERAKFLLKAVDLLVRQKEELSQIITREMGKSLSESRDEVQQAIDLVYYIAGEGRRLLGHTTTSEKTGKFAFTLRLPIGVVGLITPWNFPVLIPARKIFYSLVCGNTVILKPSSEAPMSACQLMKILQQSGIPEGVVNMVTGPGEVVGNAMVTDKRVRLVSFCGHKDTGSKIMRDAGPKRVSLELGGKNPLIIMDDADLEQASEAAVRGGYATTGQRCTASSRVIVHEKVKSRVERLVVEKIRKLKLGSGFDPETDIGPLVNEKALNKTQQYCQIGLEEGAKLLVGGKPPAGLKGWFFEPTLFTDCTSEMLICREEIFGPIVAVLSARNLGEAIDLANGVEYGLSSAIYTSSMQSAFTAVKKLQAGLTYVNHPTIGGEAHLPFGGVKYSGNNRESGAEGVNEYTELKTAYVNYSSVAGLDVNRGAP